MSLSGHTAFKALKRYVDVNDKRKKIVMANAWGKLEEDNLKVVQYEKIMFSKNFSSLNPVVGIFINNCSC